MQRVLLDIGFLNPRNPSHIMRSIRRFLGRADLTPRDVQILRGIMTQMEWYAAGRPAENPNPKSQPADRLKLQIPNSKSQTNSKSKTQNPKPRSVNKSESQNPKIKT
jgi:hypothetical protein